MKYILYEMGLVKYLNTYMYLSYRHWSPNGQINHSFGSELLKTMGDDRKWMYDGWRKNGAHSREWVDKTNKFIEHAFSLSNIGIARCPCSKCRNGLSHDKKKIPIHICRFSYMPGYEVWVHHGEELPENESVAEDVVTDENRMDEMLNAICLEFEADFEDPPTLEVQKFFELLKASEDVVDEHTTMSVFSFVT
jgi:hypothetical protein